METLSLFAADELPPVQPYTTHSRNQRGKPIRFSHPKSGRYHPCDDRCTHAKGNDCSCQCGGKNHGIHAI